MANINTTLGQACTLKAGKFVAANDIAEEYKEGLYPCYGGNGIRGYVADYSHEGTYPLIGRQGALCGNVNYAVGKFRATEHAVVVQPNLPMNVRWLYYKLLSMDLGQYATGAAQPGLAVAKLEQLPFSVPPMDEQDDLVALCDNIANLISLRKQQIAKLDELVKARFVEMFGDPATNPHHYPVQPLSHIAQYFNGLTYKPEDVSNNGTVVLRSSNIQNSQLDFEDTVHVSCAIRERLMVKENDILMCSRNGSAKLVGKVALIKGLKEPMSFGAFMMIIRSNYFPYLMVYFQLPAFRQQIQTGATTTINQITGRMLDEVVLPVPPVETVEQFAAFVAQTDQQKSIIQQSLAQLELLKKALMQKYFG